MCTLLSRRVGDKVFSGSEIIVPQPVQESGRLPGRVGLTLLFFEGEFSCSASLGAAAAAGYRQSVSVRFDQGVVLGFDYLFDLADDPSDQIRWLLGGVRWDLHENGWVSELASIDRLEFLLLKTYQVFAQETSETGVLKDFPMHPHLTEICKEGAVTNWQLHEKQTLANKYDYVALSPSSPSVADYEEMEQKCCEEQGLSNSMR